MFPDSFYNVQIGVPWADIERRLDVATVLSLCGDWVMPEKNTDHYRVLGVDTDKALHAVVIERVCSPERMHDGALLLVESQRGTPKWDWREQTVKLNRTDALDASRQTICEGMLQLPR